MKLHLLRFSSGERDTLGILYVFNEDDGTRDALAFTLEDEHRDIKVKGETRIPAGVYDVRLRTVGGHHARYGKRFDDHRGMLHLQDVPNFKYVLIHIGNDEDDTAGCILVGDSASMVGSKRSIQGSTKAYRRVYAKCVDAAESGNLTITVMDFE